MTSTEILARVRAANPGVRYAEAKGNAVGEWVPSKNRFVPIFLAFNPRHDETDHEKWMCMIEDGMIREVLSDGQPMYQDADWVE